MRFAQTFLGVSWLWFLETYQLLTMTSPLPIYTKIIIISSKKTADRDTCSHPDGLSESGTWMWQGHMGSWLRFFCTVLETKATKDSSKVLFQPSLSSLLLLAVSLLGARKPGSLQGFGHSHKFRTGKQPLRTR